MMIGYSPAMQHVYKLIGQVAGSEATVLVRGEIGNRQRAGGERDSPQQHARQGAAGEGELRGDSGDAAGIGIIRPRKRRVYECACSGASDDSKRRNGGTLFLDEIGELAPALQSKLSAGDAGAHDRAAGKQHADSGGHAAGDGDLAKSGRGGGGGAGFAKICITG